MENKNIQKHIVNISFNMGILRVNKIDVNSGFEDFVMDKAIEFERDFEKLKKEYDTDDYYMLIDKYSEKIILIWDKYMNGKSDMTE